MQHTITIPNGHITYSTTDAVFMTLDGKPVAMEFHKYLGPAFTLDRGEDGFTYMPNEGTEEWDNLWRQFNGWHSAKANKL